MSLPRDQFDQLSARIGAHYPEPVKALGAFSTCAYCYGGAMVLAALDCGILTDQAVLDVLHVEFRGHTAEPERIRDAVRFPNESRMTLFLRLLNPALGVERSRGFAREIIFANDKEHFGDALALIKAALTEEPA